MPERPDLDYQLPRLEEELRGQRIHSITLKKPAILRLAQERSLDDALVGQAIVSVRRHLHFVLFELDGDTELIVAPMLAGAFLVCPAKGGRKRDLAMTLALEDGRELRYFDRVQMGKVYVLPPGRHDLVPGFSPAGVDVLDPAAFTLARFRELCAKRRDQVKVFLLDKGALDSLGNAYADEALFRAGIHPKTFVRKLSDEDIARLHRAIPEVLLEAYEHICRAQPEMDEKLRGFLKVRNRHKEPCPVCGTTIRKVGVRGYDAFFCPTCQPETRKSGIVSWGTKSQDRS